MLEPFQTSFRIPWTGSILHVATTTKCPRQQTESAEKFQLNSLFKKERTDQKITMLPIATFRFATYVSKRNRWSAIA